MSLLDHADLLDALAAIDPAGLSYQEWVGCGMALHEGGFRWEDWDAWSRRDPARYREGECERKWRGFGRGMDRVGPGTIVKMARRRDWKPACGQPDEPLDWDAEVTAIDPSWVEEAPVGGGSAWDPARQLSDYLAALFDDDDFVGYAVESRCDRGRWVPSSGGSWKRRAGRLRDELARCGGDLGKVVGDWHPEAGAWIRFNPLDGRGCGNADVVEFRYALVESDVLPVGKQRGMIEAMNLPCAAIVSSGGKSVHAIVRIDAGTDYDLYRRRVERLYRYCREHGFEPDAQNKNPSRLSRMPGVMRGGRRQELLAVNTGAESWAAWEEWAAEMEDDLPDDRDSEDWDDPVRLPPPLIGTEEDGIIRQGQKMIVVGDSKMGKSFALIDLAEAICTGGRWLGMPCAEGPVFYVNLEIEAEEFRSRRRLVWEDRESHGQGASGLPALRRNLFVWNLRGRAATLDELAPKLVRRMLRRGPRGTFKLAVIDPVYKVNGGDDNDARMVARFTNAVDLIAEACGCAVAYAHHHPKGTAGQKKSMDRMAGSGVYARDADTVIDFTRIQMTGEQMRTAGLGGCAAYRATMTARSFPSPPDKDVIFRFPRFYEDASGRLGQFGTEGSDPEEERAQRAAERAQRSRQRKIEAVRDAKRACAEAGVLPTAAELYDRLRDIDGTGREGAKIARTTFNGWVRAGARGTLGAFRSVQESGGRWLVLDEGESLEATYGLVPMPDDDGGDGDDD